MRKYILSDLSNKGIKIDYTSSLNDQQLDVVFNGDGHCLVLAGAGSGKTRTLVYRVAFLIEKGISPDNILLVTFTNKAAREMTSRCREILKSDIKGLWSGTFHHIANKILRMYIDRLGYRKNYVILDESDSQDLVKTALGYVAKEAGMIKKDLPKASVIQSIISFSQNSQKPISSVIRKLHPKFIHLTDVIDIVKDKYEQIKKETNSLDYDDLLYLCLTLLRDHSDIREKLASKFRYILVDEYQDTNILQADIIDLLGSVHKNILVVGDDAQSIYSFRAANIENILNFPKRYSDAKIFKLEKNYRSTRFILNLANNSIKNNRFNFPKELQPVKNGVEIKPALVPLSDPVSQARFITQRIEELRSEEGVPLSEISVLFRSAFHSVELEVELSKADIPYIKRGGIRYFEQAHIKDILAFLRIAHNPLDEVALRRVLYLLSGIGEVTFLKIKEFMMYKIVKEGLSVEQIDFSGLTLPLRARESLDKVLKYILKAQKYLEKEQVDIPAIIHTAYRDIYRSVLKDKFDNPDEREMDIDVLAEFAKNYKSLESFLSDAVLTEGYKGERFDVDGDREEDVMVLSTIHQAKGLEWKVVFVMHLVEGAFPHYRSLARDEDLEEERRLFYVSVTRAKEELYLTYPISYEAGYSYMSRVLSGPSRFLLELPENVYEKWEIEEDTPSSILDFYLD